MLILSPAFLQAEIFMKKVVRAAQAMRINAVRIACINRAKTSLGIPLPMLTAALQKCYDKYFLPVWGYPVKLYNTKKARPTDWQFVYFDDADAAGAEGYHDLTHRGQPVSKVFVKTSLEDNVPVSVTASHELFEMVIDPIANLWAEATNRTQYGYEMCDPVEEDTFMVDGVEMSNFVHPSWFEPFKHPKGTKFDHLEKLTKPFSMSKGGYVIIKRNGRVKEKFGSRAKAKGFAQEDRTGHRSEFRKPRGLHIKVRKKRSK
jgi:hypothetical protein